MNETNAPQKDMRYNITGKIADLVVRDGKNGQFATFNLVREGKKPVSAVAFAEKATQLVGQFQNGSIAKIFGFFDSRIITSTSQRASGSAPFRAPP